MWLSGRKLSVVGLSAPETSASVPVSAIPANAIETALGSWPSEAPCRISSDVASHGIAVKARVGAHAQRRRAVVVAQEARDLGRRIGEAGDLGDGRLGPFSLRLERRDAGVEIALPAPRHDARAAPP